MKTRYTYYDDYGMTKEDVRAVLNYFRPARTLEKAEMVVKTAIEVNPDIWMALVMSVITKASYETIVTGRDVYYSKDDFYAYRRKVIFLLWDRLRCGQKNSENSVK